MSIRNVIVCADTASYPAAVSSPVCPVGTGQIYVETFLPDAPVSVNPQDAAEFFGFGFSIILASYLAALGVGKVLSVVRHSL